MTSRTATTILALGLQVHCPGTSILRADGTTECELPGCSLPHDLHEWVATAGDVDVHLDPHLHAHLGHASDGALGSHADAA